MTLRDGLEELIEVYERAAKTSDSSLYLNGIAAAAKDLRALLSTADSEQRETVGVGDHVQEGTMKRGDQVTWTSQAAGSEKTKTGVIVAVVPPGAYLSEERVASQLPEGTEGFTDGMPRNHESYIVRVGRRKRLYWPRVKNLRRKLEVAEHEKNLATVEAIGHDHAEGHLGALVDELRAKLAASSLANVALRTSLEEISSAVREMAADLKGNVAGCRRLSDALITADAALALPADSLAQEVVGYMQHMGDCNADLNGPGEEVYACTCGLDALLARIGGPK